MTKRAEMRKVVVGAFLSLDGIMQSPGGPNEDPVGGFKHGGWSSLISTQPAERDLGYMAGAT
jgi:hypothetical protein